VTRRLIQRFTTAHCISIDGVLSNLYGSAHSSNYSITIRSRFSGARIPPWPHSQDIANITKISPAALNALEHNDFARLPGGVYSRAYVRAFAAAVGLDADDRFYIMEPIGSIVLVSLTCSPAYW
jgi:hypothetical protein